MVADCRFTFTGQVGLKRCFIEQAHRCDRNNSQRSLKWSQRWRKEEAEADGEDKEIRGRISSFL